MSTALRVAISAALLAVIAYRVDWTRAYGLMAVVDWHWLFAAFVFFNGAVVAAALRWAVLIDATTRTPVRREHAVSATYSSLWLSNFLPTAFGGDVARVATARVAGLDLPTAIAVSVVDRYIGFVTLAVVFACSESFEAYARHVSPFLGAACLLAVVFCGVLIALIGGARIRVPRRWLRTKLMRHAARYTGVLRALGGKSNWSVWFVALNIFACLCGIAAYWAAANCLPYSVPFPAATAAATLGTLASSIPISLSGWGVREGTVTAVLAQATAIPASDAGLIALLNALVIAATSLLGAATSWRLRWRPREDPSAAKVVRY